MKNLFRRQTSVKKNFMGKATVKKNLFWKTTNSEELLLRLKSADFNSAFAPTWSGNEKTTDQKSLQESLSHVHSFPILFFLHFKSQSNFETLNSLKCFVLQVPKNKKQEKNLEIVKPWINRGTLACHDQALTFMKIKQALAYMVKILLEIFWTWCMSEIIFGYFLW